MKVPSRAKPSQAELGHFNFRAETELTSDSMYVKKSQNYRISSYSFRGNYSFLHLEIQRSQYIKPKVTVHKCAETIQGDKLFKGGNYMRIYGMYFNGIVDM